MIIHKLECSHPETGIIVSVVEMIHVLLVFRISEYKFPMSQNRISEQVKVQPFPCIGIG